MKKLMGRVQASLRDSSSYLDQSRIPATDHARQPPGVSHLPAPTPQDVIRYRYHHGTNLGSIFVLERWLFPSMFEPASGSRSSASGISRGDSELDAVTFSLETRGRDATICRWRSHWASAVTDEDLRWLACHARCTSIRLPVGYWVLGAQFCKDTAFESVAEVYEGAWGAVRDVVARARAFGIGVLIDLHALPGGANKDAHSGTSSGSSEFWENGRFQQRATECLAFMAREIKNGGMDGAIGLQIVNEVVWNAKGLYAWYDEVLQRIGEIDETIPIYVSDGWDLGRALKWTSGRRGGNPVIVDTHKYYTFSDKDRSQEPAEIIRRLRDELQELDCMEGSLSDHGEAQVIVGEYSCVLDEQTWSRVRPDQKDAFIAQFGTAQSEKWQQRAGGAYFWTWKMEWMDGGEWGLVKQVKKENIKPPPHLLVSYEEVAQLVQHAQQQRSELATAARESHEAYWTRTSPGNHFEHERYSDGWDVGFSDALAFFVMKSDGGLGDNAKATAAGGDKIGCLDIWVKKRLAEYMTLERRQQQQAKQQQHKRGGQGSREVASCVWEWEQGLRAGILAFHCLVDVCRVACCC